MRAALAIHRDAAETVQAGGASVAADPVSTNQTLGNTGNKYSLVLDRAFLKLRPVDDLTLWGGRIPNPFRPPRSWSH